MHFPRLSHKSHNASFDLSGGFIDRRWKFLKPRNAARKLARGLYLRRDWKVANCKRHLGPLTIHYIAGKRISKCDDLSARSANRKLPALNIICLQRGISRAIKISALNFSRIGLSNGRLIIRRPPVLRFGIHKRIRALSGLRRARIKCRPSLVVFSLRVGKIDACRAVLIGLAKTAGPFGEQRFSLSEHGGRYMWELRDCALLSPDAEFRGRLYSEGEKWGFVWEREKPRILIVSFEAFYGTM